MMATTSGTSEIVESVDEMSSESKMNVNAQERQIGKLARKYAIEDDINKLFEAIDIRNSPKSIGQSDQGGRDALRKSAMKRPMRVGYSQASGIGISESVSLKQALRGLCISQASEMAAVKKRLSKPPALADAGAMKRLYQAVVVETNESSGQSLNLGNGNLVEISLVPERNTSDLSDKAFESNHVSHVEQSNHNTESSTQSSDELAPKGKVAEDLPMDEIVPSSARVNSQCSEAGPEQSKKLKLPNSLNGTPTDQKLLVLDEIITASDEVPITSAGAEKREEVKLDSPSCSSSHNTGNKLIKPVSSTPRLIRPVFRSKSFNHKKFMQYSTSPSGGFSQQSSGMNNFSGCSSSDVSCQTPNSAMVKGAREEDEVSPVSTSGNTSMEVNSKPVVSAGSKPGPNFLFYGKPRSIATKADKESRSREKGEISQSSKSSIGDYSSTTSFSEESHLSGASRSGHRPHMSKDVRWEAINCVKKRHGNLGLRNFKLLRKLGGGDIGSVYLSELVGTNCLFAVKVMDNDFLASRRKMARALTEKEILEMLDHPFLPTLFANFTTDKYSCLVMEYCPGGDLHILRQKQPNRSFTEQAARFYVAEVLLALEYLHMLGVVYRDLKPENVLVREDGHIMLTDFDLSLRCAVNPTLLKSSSPIVNTPKKMSSPCSESSCIDPFCLNPSWQVSCFTPRFLSAAAKSRKLKSEIAAQVSPLPQLVVEPTNARSNSFVGTHEYLAPEIIKGEGHGSAVDWWTLGIFLYELLYGKTPFKGPGNEDTLANVVSQCLKFPEIPMVSSHARDLMRRLLQKEPENRLGSERGAAEIKQHPFFEGLNFALIRCATPPELPKLSDLGYTSPETISQSKKNSMCQKESKNTGDDIEFEMF